MQTVSWTSDVFLVVPHPDGLRVLSRAGQLPHLHLNKRSWVATVQTILPDVRDLLGHVVVLRCLHNQSDKSTRMVKAVYELEVLEDVQGDWVEPERLHSLEPDVARAVASCLSEPDAPLRSPWARRGWFSEASDWIHAQLEGVERIEQVKNWGISSVLRARTTSGDCYFKVSTARALFAHEPLVTQALASRFPELIPAPMAVDAQRRWMILPDIGVSLEDVSNLSLPDWQHLIGLYARLQREMVGQEAWLFRAGCLDRRAPVLKAHVREFLSNNAALSGLEPEVVAQVRSLEDQWLVACDQLSDTGIPDSLVHGDWGARNIAVQDGVYRFYDWTDACVAHPFFDVPTVLDDVVETFGEVAREPLLKAYLEPWTDFAPLEQLKDILPVVQVAGCLHQAVSLWKILEGLEPSAQFELSWQLPMWLRRAVEVTAGLTSA